LSQAFVSSLNAEQIALVTALGNTSASNAKTIADQLVASLTPVQTQLATEAGILSGGLLIGQTSLLSSMNSNLTSSLIGGGANSVTSKLNAAKTAIVGGESATKTAITNALGAGTGSGRTIYGGLSAITANGGSLNNVKNALVGTNSSVASKMSSEMSKLWNNTKRLDQVLE
jgi:hypothetical protein